MKNKISSFFLITILLLLISCENFMNGEDTRKEIEDAIAYNNAQECTVVFRADAGTGEFLGSVERTYKVGYESEVQFELNTEDYVFKTLEAVCQTDRSVSRASSVEFKDISRNDKKGIYKYKVKLLSDTKDVLIRPVCLAVPKITNITPAFESNGCDQDSVIKITFNKPLNPETFKSEYISIYSDDDLSEYFDEAKFTSDNKTIWISPKADKLILAPDGQKSSLSIKVNYDLYGMKDADGLDVSAMGTYTYKSNKNFGNQKNVKVLVRADSNYGSFLSDGEKECVVGYTIDLQFTLNKEDFKFLDFEAVSSADNSLSRSDCISIENKDYNDDSGIYKARVRVISEQNDILIRPKCLAFPAVSSHIPALPAEAQTTDKIIKVQFNKAVLEAQNTRLTQNLFTYSNISITCLNDNSNMADEYFEAPVFDEQKMLLSLTPKAKKLKAFIDGLHMGTVDLRVSLSSAISATKDDKILALKQDDNSTFMVRYKADTEKTDPSAIDFLVTRNAIQLNNVNNLAADQKFKLDAIDITADEIPAADIQKNRAGNGAVYIYGRYFDEDSGVKDVVVSGRMLQDNGELSTATETTFNSRSDSQIAQFTSDGQGNTSFVIKYDFANLGKAYVLDIVVRDYCDNSSLAKTVSVFVPKYGDALGENFYYLKNAPDYENEDLTIDQYSAELKNLKIYPTSFTAYSDVKIPVEDLTIYCEYKDKTGADKKQKFNLNEGENPYWNCLLNVDNLANLNTKITIYDGDFIYDQRDFKFPARTAFTIDWLYDNYLTSSDPRYQIRILAEPGHSVFGVKASPSDDNPDGYVFEIEYPLPSYEQLDIYTRYKWCLETSNQQGLYSDAIRFEDILEEYNTDISAVGIKSIDEDKSSWHTNGGYFVYTITLADDTWEEGKFEHIFYDVCYVGASEEDPQEIQKNEYTITVKVPLSKLAEEWANIIITGKKGLKKSSPYLYRINTVSAEEYDVVPPKLSVYHYDYDSWKVKFSDTDGGSGPNEADFTIGGQNYHFDENYLIKYVSSTLVEKVRAQGDGTCSIEYTASDKAGNTKTADLVFDDGGHGDDFKVVKTSSTGVSLVMDRYTYEYDDTQTKFYFYEFENNDWKSAPSVSSTDDIDYHYAGENNDIFRYQEYVNGLPESKFLKIIGYNDIYFPAPQYVYLGEWGSGDYDLLMPNASSKKSVIICSDAPVFVHTLVTKCSYEKCKDWDSSNWEYYKEDIGKKILNFTADKEVEGNLVTGDHTPKIYKIPDIAEGSCYCVIAHFANGEVLMSQVMQK